MAGRGGTVNRALRLLRWNDKERLLSPRNRQAYEPGASASITTSNAAASNYPREYYLRVMCHRRFLAQYQSRLISDGLGRDFASLQRNFQSEGYLRKPHTAFRNWATECFRSISGER